MNTRHRIYLLVLAVWASALRWVLCLGLVFGSLQLQAACSAHVGKVVINEVRVGSSGGEASFVELKVLDPSVIAASSNFSGWKLAAYNASNGNKGEVDVGSAFTNIAINTCGQNSSWLRIPDSSLGGKVDGASSLNLVLFDSAGGGQIVDIMRLGSTSVGSYYDPGSVYTACASVEGALPAAIGADTKYDALVGPGASVKDFFRTPDGVGSWGGGLTPAGSQTKCASNDGGGAFSVSKVASVSTVPVNTNFTFTLYAQNGSTGSAQTGVQITDNLSTAGLTYVSCTTASGTCTYTGGVVTWSVGSVAVNTTKTATLIVSAPTAGAKINTITSNVGTPVATATATVQAYAPLVDWHMDESSWNGTAGEVKDSSGNGYHGRAKIANGSTAVPTTASGSPAYSDPSGSQSTCGYGEFDRTSGTARTYSYVELSGIPALPSSFTFAAWIRSTNATAQHQRIIVRDDAQDGWGLSLADGTGQGKLRFFNRNITNSGTVTGQGSNPGAGVFALDTNAVITSNNWFFIAASIDTSGKVITLYVYDAAGTLLATTSSAFAGTWADGSGTAAIGGETSASSEGTQTSWHFLGNIDELQIYSGVLSQSNLDVLRTRTRTCSGAQHVELVHNGAGLTCAPKAVTVLGCTTSASCNGVVGNQYTSANLSFTPATIAGAQWCLDSACALPISGAVSVANGATIYLREPTARTDTMAGTASGVSNTTVQCTNTSSGAFNASTACQVDFSSSGFLVNVPNHTSCTAQTVTLQAVKSSATGTTCAPAFQNVNRDISLYSGYTNPTTGSKTASLSYLTTGGATASVSALSTSAGSPTMLVGLYFDNTGTATLSNFSYPDVGQVTLFPTYAGSASSGDAGLALAAISGNVFIAAPASFDVVATGPYVAGQSFTAKATAKNGCSTPAIAPNFGKETTPQTVLLKPVTAGVASVSNSQLVGPVGGQLGSLTPGAFTLAKCSPASAGAVCDSALAWTEVGDLALSAVNTGYLGSTFTSWGAGTAGRFKPAFFKTELNPGQSCGTFTYSGQPFRVKVTALSAANAVLGSASATTQNYTGSYAKAVTLGADGASACTPDVTGFTNNTLAATDFTSIPGIGSTPVVTSSAPAPLTYTRAAAPPSSVTVCAADADGVTSHGQAQASVAIRNGRARMTNAYGSELLDLPVVFRTEYLFALPNDWRLNTADTCTAASLNLTAVGSSDITGNTCVWDDPASPASGTRACATAPTVANRKYLETGVTGTDSNGAAGFAGNFNVWLKLPGAGRTGSIDLSATVPSWLQGATGSPKARVTFGVFKSPLIYSRENY